MGPTWNHGNATSQCEKKSTTLGDLLIDATNWLF